MIKLFTTQHNSTEIYTSDSDVMNNNRTVLLPQMEVLNNKKEILFDRECQTCHQSGHCEYEKSIKNIMSEEIKTLDDIRQLMITTKNENKRNKKSRILNVSLCLTDVNHSTTITCQKARKKRRRKKRRMKQALGLYRSSNRNCIKYFIKSQIKRSKISLASPANACFNTGYRKDRRSLKKYLTSYLIQCIGNLNIKISSEGKQKHNSSIKEILHQWKHSSVIPSIVVLPVFRQSLDSYFTGMGNSLSEPNASMHYEWLRLETFAGYPADSPVRPIRLAESGFYWTGNATEVRCYSCGKSYKDWEMGDVPRDVHFRISPNCEHLLGNRSNNIAIETTGNPSSSDTVPQSQSATLSSENDTQITTPNVNNQQLNNSITSTAVTSNEITDPSGSNFQQQQQRHLHQHQRRGDENSQTSQNRTSPQTSTTNATTSTTTVNTTTTQQHTNSCSNTRARVNLDPLGINFDRPKYPTYAVLTVRISSFQGWPAYLTQTAREMALAGFYYAGYGDYCRCFFCGGGLRNWEAGDDPWVEHARWFPRCSFVRQNKGGGFIELVLQKQAELDNNSSQPSANSLHNPPSASAERPGLQNNPKQNVDISSLPAVQSVLQMGYSLEMINKAISNIKSSSDRGKDANSLSAVDILETIFKIEQSCQGATGGDDKEEHEKVKPDEAKDAASTLEVATNGITAVSINDTQSLIEENRKLRANRLCRICKDKDASITFLPCGHLVCCEDCAPAMRKCPVCKDFIKGTVKTWLV